jgi:hypothetical protein
LKVNYIEKSKYIYFVSIGKKLDGIYHYSDPEEEDSTELGEVPQKARQGSIGTAAYSINKHYNIAYLGEGKDKK